MLKELKLHHREIARLSFEGYKPAEIATRTSSKLVTVYAILRDALCKSYMNGLADRADNSVIDVREKMAEMNLASLDTLAHILSKDNIEITPASVRLGAANSVLDRNGYKAPEKHEHMHGHFTAEDLMNLQKRNKEVDAGYLN